MKRWTEEIENALILPKNSDIKKEHYERPFNMNFLKPDKLSLWEKFCLLFCKAHYGFDTSMKHEYTARVTLKCFKKKWYVTAFKKIPKPNINNPSQSQ